MKIPAPPLLLVTDRRQARRPLIEIVDAACAAGCRWISLREKDLPASDLLVLARRLAPIVRRHGARLTLHGSADIAHAAGLDGVHLSAGSDALGARGALGESALIGISVHGVTDLAHAAGADYVIAGPAYETASKPGYGPGLGVAGVARMVGASSVPVIAIGGIDAGNAAPLLAAGAFGIAVMGGVMRARDPGGEVRALLAAVAPH